VIVCAKGAGQNLIEGPLKKDYSGNPVLDDICVTLTRRIKDHSEERGLEMFMRFIDPSYIIHSVSANAGDCIYCDFLGQHAVHSAMAGKTGMVVTQIKSSMVYLPLDLVVLKRRTLNTRSDYWCSFMEATAQKDFFL